MSRSGARKERAARRERERERERDKGWLASQLHFLSLQYDAKLPASVSFNFNSKLVRPKCKTSTSLKLLAWFRQL